MKQYIQHIKKLPVLKAVEICTKIKYLLSLYKPLVIVLQSYQIEYSTRKIVSAVTQR